MGELSVTVLQLHATSGQSREVKAFPCGRCSITKGSLHKPVHATAALMLSVGQNLKATLQ